MIERFAPGFRDQVLEFETMGPPDVEERIAEILTRYPADHVVHRSIARGAPGLRAQTPSHR